MGRSVLTGGTTASSLDNNFPVLFFKISHVSLVLDSSDCIRQRFFYFVPYVVHNDIQDLFVGHSSHRVEFETQAKESIA